MKKILLVEDDPTLGSNLNQRLQQEFHVLWCRSVKEAQENILSESWDLAILDIGLPDGSGFDVAEQLRRQQNCQFIFLTAQADAEHRLKGFEMGAQEYIPKPFYLKELLIRVKHVLKEHAPTNMIQLNNIEVNFSDYSVRKSDGSVEFPQVTDLKILKLLIQRSPQPISRDDILNEIWGFEKNSNHRTVDNSIVRLRSLLGPAADRIRSIRGIGYQWQGEEK